MKKYDIFLVDADNTVLDFHASSRAALKAAFESFGKAWTEEYAKKFSVFNDSLWERLERKELTSHVAYLRLAQSCALYTAIERKLGRL